MSVNSKMTAIADAIRGKTGGRDALTLDQMAEAIGTIKAEPTLQELTITENGEYSPPDGVDGFSKVVANIIGGNTGNVKVATGSFTQISTGDTAPEIIHNLGTTKIIALFWISNDVLVVPTAGYQIIAVSFVNTPAFLGDNIQVDCTGYNSGKFTDISTVDFSELKMGAVVRSPWTTQTNFTAPNVSSGRPNECTITENSFTFADTNNKFIAGYTYNYMIIGF